MYKGRERVPVVYAGYNKYPTKQIIKNATHPNAFSINGGSSYPGTSIGMSTLPHVEHKYCGLLIAAMYNQGNNQIPAVIKTKKTCAK